MANASLNAVLNAGKLSGAAYVSVCRKNIAAKGAGALYSGAGAIGGAGVENAGGKNSIL